MCSAQPQRPLLASARAWRQHGRMPEIPPFQESPYELSRLLQNLVKWGTVEAVRAKPLAVRMRCGDNVTDWLKPMMLGAGAEFGAYRMPEKGEQGVALCAGGDLGQGVALIGIFSDAMNQPSDGPPHLKLNKGNTHYARYEGGVLTLCIGDASITIAQHSIILQAGEASIVIGPDTIIAEPDIVIGGISFKSHRHGGVRRGDSATDGPR